MLLQDRSAEAISIHSEGVTWKYQYRRATRSMARQAGCGPAVTVPDGQVHFRTKMSKNSGQLSAKTANRIVARDKAWVRSNSIQRYRVAVAFL
jgi:hypothetical protein